jgi:hypothetical protein
MTWYDLVRKYFPNASDKVCEYILWEETCYPVGTPEDVETMIKELAERAVLKEES